MFQEMTDGFLQMAKARSNMGQKTIGSLQYDDRDMMPMVLVDPASIGDSQGHPTYDLMKNTPEDAEVEGGVRKRVSGKVNEKDIVTVGAENDSVRSDPKEDTAKLKPRDPLLMFGVLVPQALRLSKSCFQRSLPVISKLCSTQSKITRLKVEYQTLLRQDC